MSNLDRIPHPSWTFRISRISVFSALSVVGSFIRLPSPVQTVTFDSAPGFFAALFFGPIDGAIVTGLGHVASASINGFPLGILHLPIAAGLAGAGTAIGLVNRLDWRASPALALAVGIVINIGLVVLAVPVLGWEGTLAFAPLLAFAASINGLLAGFTYVGVRGKVRV
jgi:uncharacterized membrane protein